MVPNIEQFAIQQTVLEQTAVIVKYRFIKCKQSIEGSIISQILKVRFPAEAYIIFLKFSLTERCSHPGEDHTNEIKHDIHPE